jgi:hypothetical protein
MIIIRDKDLRIVQRSKNLRGVLMRSRKLGLERIDIYGPYEDKSAQFGVTWVDGSFTFTNFASYKVLSNWHFVKKHYDVVRFHEPETEAI